METAALSKTVRLSNEDIGLLQRRTNEISRRIEEGCIERAWAFAEMQRIIEGRKLPVVRYRSTARPLEFKRPNAAERKRSRAGLDMRLPEWRERLKWPERNTEHIMAEFWEAECIPDPSINYGRTPINAIIGDEKPTERDVFIINSTMQWLGTNVGRDFLRRLVRTAELYID